jgi:hypothetical protein
MAIVITRRAIREFHGYTVWRQKHWQTAFFSKTFGGNVECRRAKLIFKLPLGFGLFWAFGKAWIE